MPSTATIELTDLVLPARIGTYGHGDIVPDEHVLDLTLWIDPALVLIEQDGMAHVFDYDPLLAKIDRLARDCHYDTQERLMSRVAGACAAYPEVTGLEISLRKHPVRDGSGTLGVRLHLNAEDLVRLR